MVVVATGVVIPGAARIGMHRDAVLVVAEQSAAAVVGLAAAPGEGGSTVVAHRRPLEVHPVALRAAIATHEPGWRADGATDEVVLSGVVRVGQGPGPDAGIGEASAVVLGLRVISSGCGVEITRVVVDEFVRRALDADAAREVTCVARLHTIADTHSCARDAAVGAAGDTGVAAAALVNELFKLRLLVPGL